ncbi:MAG: hypothetical protein D6797_04565 [Bdellovibrio sp.]|nr:MAG: hypothetical protein D6797_04565 [Bdellovibrio sp.]
MSFKNTKIFVFGTLFITFSLIITIFQNCSDVAFETTSELLKAGVGSLRQVTLQPQFKENRPDIDVTTILDNSNSMSLIQDSVKKSLSATTSALKGFNGSFQLYTTTQELTPEDKKNHKSDIHKNILLDSFYKIANENGELVPALNFSLSDLASYKNAMDANGMPLYNSYEKVTQYLNHSPFQNITFHQNMDNNQFAQFQQNVFNEINKVDTNGSSMEMGLCSLLRNIEEHKSDKVGKFQTFIIATNEDDSSTEQNCLKEFIQRYSRVPNSPSQYGQTPCTDEDPDCHFTYTVKFRPAIKETKKYRYSYVAQERLSFSPSSTIKKSYKRREYLNYQLKNDKVRTIKTSLSYKKARRIVQHRIKENIWTMQFKRKVVVGYDDGLPITQVQTQTITYKQKTPGMCPSNSTSFQTCSGSALNDFNTIIAKQYPDKINGTCQVKCTESLSGWKRDWIDNELIVVKEPVTFPSEVATIDACRSWVAQKRGYTGKLSDLIPYCSTTYTNNNNINNYLGRTQNISVSNLNRRSDFGSCPASRYTCNATEKNAAIALAKLSQIPTEAISCENSCSESSLYKKGDQKLAQRVPAGGLCNGLSYGDPTQNVTDSCTNSELQAVKTKLESSLAAMGIHTSLSLNDISCTYTCEHVTTTFRPQKTSLPVDKIPSGELCPGKRAGDPSEDVKLPCSQEETSLALNSLQKELDAAGIPITLTTSDISCNYLCKHRNSSEKVLSTKYIDPWQGGLTNTSISCNSPEFSDIQNVHSCKLVYTQAARKDNFIFESTNGKICEGNYTADSIRAHAEASNLPDYGTDEPIESCTRSNGHKEVITYSWKPTDQSKISLIAPDGIVATIARKAKEVYGDKFYILAFINDPEKEAQDCQGANLEDYYGPSNDLNYEGKTFKALEKVLGPQHMKTLPACIPTYKKDRLFADQPTYETSMNFVFDLITKAAQRTYKVDLDENKGEWVYRVRATENNGSMKVIEKRFYKWEKGLLSFDSSLDLSRVKTIYVDIATPL